MCGKFECLFLSLSKSDAVRDGVRQKKEKKSYLSLLFAADIIEIHALGNVDDCIMQHQLLKIVKAFERATRRNDLDAIGAMEV